jgi:hypothetical protein
MDENGYATFEMRQSRRGTVSGTIKSSRSMGAVASGTLGRSAGGTLGRSAGGAAAANTLRSTVSRKSTNFAMINGSRNPPRPNPSMVTYSDEDSAKGYDENPDDSDSLTEKPSEISSTDSQVKHFAKSRFTVNYNSGNLIADSFSFLFLFFLSKNLILI